MTVLVPTQADATASVQQRTGHQTAAYERHAYLVYNLALRVTCDRSAAAQAAERAFVTVLDRPDPDAEVIAVAVRTALEAAPQQPKLDGAGDPASAHLLRATAVLPPVQRAALALEGLAGLDDSGVAGALGLGPEAGSSVMRAARAALAMRLGAPPEDAANAYGEWLWAPPPDELWRSVWAQLHGASRVLAPERRRSAKPRLSARRAARARRPLVVLVLLAAAAGGGYTAFGGGQAAERPAGSTAAPAAPAPSEPADVPSADPADPEASVEDIGPNPDAGGPVRKGKPLSPEELDELRTGELKALSRYEKQQADPGLSARERAEARGEIERIKRLAERRIAVAERRERAARAELVRERAARQREAAARARAEQRAAAREEQRRQERPARRSDRTQQAPATPPPGEEETGCLFNEADGSYVCPVE